MCVLSTKYERHRTIENNDNSSFAYAHKKKKIYYSHLARISASLKMKYSLSLISTLVPPYSGNRTLSPA